MTQNTNYQSIETVIDLENPESMGKPLGSVSADTKADKGSSAINADSPEIQIEIQDDTPEKDRGKARPEPLPDAPEGVIPSDDELKNYSESVQKRMKRMTYEFHEQRRQREAAERQVAEAAQIAKKLYEDNLRLRQGLKSGEQALIESTKGRVEAQIEAAKDRLRKAHENGDTEALVTAQGELSDLQARKVQVEVYRPQYQQDPPPAPELRQPAQPQKPAVDPEAEEWAGKNKWFQKDPEMTSAAFGIHQRLVESGIDPRREPSRYYAEIDKVMRKRFPEYEWPDRVVPQEQPQAPRRQASSVVAPATRSSSGSVSPDGRKVTLTSSQVSLAKRLGLTPQQYAVELLKQERERS